jgi:hypothetical protein
MGILVIEQTERGNTVLETSDVDGTGVLRYDTPDGELQTVLTPQRAATLGDAATRPDRSSYKGYVRICKALVRGILLDDLGRPIGHPAYFRSPLKLVENPPTSKLIQLKSFINALYRELKPDKDDPGKELCREALLDLVKKIKELVQSLLVVGPMRGVVVTRVVRNGSQANLWAGWSLYHRRPASLSRKALMSGSISRRLRALIEGLLTPVEPSKGWETNPPSRYAGIWKALKESRDISARLRGYGLSLSLFSPEGLSQACMGLVHDQSIQKFWREAVVKAFQLHMTALGGPAPLQSQTLPLAASV